jgi:hypothetical protein
MSNKLNILRQISTRIVLFHIGIYFSSVIKLCSSLFLLNKNYKVSYMMRRVNQVAHNLILTIHFNTSHQIFYYCPPYIETTIINKMP